MLRHHATHPSRRGVHPYVMGKGPNLINELGPSPNIDHERDMVENGAPATASKLIYIALAIGLVVLFALVAIGLHMPTGG